MQKNNRTILFLAPYPFGRAPSQRFRFEEYIGILRQEGYEVQFHSFLSDEGWKVLYRRGHIAKKSIAIFGGFLRRFALLLGPVFRADIVFIHREATPVGPPMLEFLIARVYRKPIVYDFDDAIWIPNTSRENRWVAWIKFHQKVGQICKWSFKVSAGNSYLADYARSFNPHVVINPTTIDTIYLHKVQKKSVRQNITIGWTGTHSTLKYLRGLKNVISRISKQYPLVRWLIIADRHPGSDFPTIVFIPWSKQTEIEDLARIDIGVMPLEQDPWSEGKCSLKALQFMALEIPTIASPVGINTSVIDHGKNGFLCSGEEEWMNCLERLIIDSELRRSIGAEGRVKVISQYSVQSNTVNFLSLFS